MVKGVNRQVLELRETGSPYFERALFFVKPEFAFADEKKLREAAQETLAGTDTLPRTRRRKWKQALLWTFGGSAAAGAGALVTALLVH